MLYFYLGLNHKFKINLAVFFQLTQKNEEKKMDSIGVASIL